MMATALTAMTILIAGWLVTMAAVALLDGPQPRVFRLGREATIVVLSILGTAGYILIVDARPKLLPAAAAFVAGAGFGFLATSRNGALPSDGAPVVWTSPWSMALLAGSAAAATAGTLGAGDVLTEVGVAGLVAAVGFAVGALGFGATATGDARTALEEDLDPSITCGNCGAAVPAADRHCTGCGAVSPTACATCGTAIGENNAWCTACGSERISPLPDAAPDAVTVRFCVACFDRVPMEADFCANCGVPLSAACRLCGAPLMADHLRCPLCDVDLDLADAVAAAGLLDDLVTEIEAELDAEESTGPRIGPG